MKRPMKIYSTLILLLISVVNSQAQEQEILSMSDLLVAQPSADRDVHFDLADSGIYKKVEFGADLAWANEQNFRRVILFTGLDQLDIVRGSFQPTAPITNGELSTQQLNDLNWRLFLLNKYVGKGIDLELNSDHPTVDDWYKGNAANWVTLIKVTAQKFMDAGHQVVTIAPFNEPDYSATGQGTIQDMYNVVSLLNKDSFFDNMRISGGNTLNPDFAKEWYQYLKPAGVDEGNTHQLAGTFDNYANFFEVVRANGHTAANDELHNVMEALVGYEYGMQTGIWWGPAEYARGEMVKAMDGRRIGYAEHRPNWTAAAVYRHPDGHVQAFGGVSERQARTTTYKYISKDRPVYFDGVGPQYEFVLEMPGGTGYQTDDQRNAERVINITWGDDIQPVINGEYKIVNKNSGLVLESSGMSAGSSIRQGTYSSKETQKWNVKPVSNRIGGDFSYYQIIPASNSAFTLDLVNYSLDNGANVQLWNAGTTSNQQWYLDYAGDGYFYIRSRESSHCLEVANASTSNGGNILQWEKTGGDNQKWRLLPVDAAIEFTAPFANPGLEATAHNQSILLSWPEIPSADLAGYIILRSTKSGGPYETIAKNLTVKKFVDNTVEAGVEYFYIVKSIDRSLNTSDASNEVSATASGENDLVAHYAFDGAFVDSTQNLFNGASLNAAAYEEGMIGSQALKLNGSTQFVQLPAGIANHEALSIAAWVKWDGGESWQRIFDFGNGQTESMYLTPKNAGGQMQFSLSYSGFEKSLTASNFPTGEWTHVAVTIDAQFAYLYINGQPADIEVNFKGSPKAFSPVLNYIGKSQYPDPLFRGSIDDFRVYNYALDPSEVEALADTTSEVIPDPTLGNQTKELVVWPVPANEVLNISGDAVGTPISIFNINGVKVYSGVQGRENTQINIAFILDGIYFVKIGIGENMKTQKIYIAH